MLTCVDPDGTCSTNHGLQAFESFKKSHRVKYPWFLYTFYAFVCFFLKPKSHQLFQNSNDWNLGEMKSTPIFLAEEIHFKDLNHKLWVLSRPLCGGPWWFQREDAQGAGSPFRRRRKTGIANGVSHRCLQLRLLVECSSHNSVYLSISEYCTAMWQFLIYTKMYREMLESKICVRSSRFQFYPYCSLHMSIQDKVVW